MNFSSLWTDVQSWAAHPFSEDMDLFQLFLLVSAVFIIAFAWWRLTDYFVE